MLSRRSVLRGAAVALAAPFINRGRFALAAESKTTYSTRAIDLVGRSTVIDMLGLLTLNYRKLMQWEAEPREFRAEDLARLKRSGITIFHPAVGYTTGDTYAEVWRDITGWNTFLANHKDQFECICTPAQLKGSKTSGKIGILIGQQNSAHFRTLDEVDKFYKLGQRVSQLTYCGNKLGGGCADASNVGLTSYGAEVVARMNQLGMAIDLSHCSDRTTQDAIEASAKPALVTHSNCRALNAGSARCKTDEAIAKLAAKGGVFGVTMVRSFVRSYGRVTMENVLDHIDHLVDLVGVEHVGIGSDVDLNGRDAASAPRRFDLDGVDYSKKIFDLAEGLIAREYSDRDIELILGGNFQRALGDIWGG
jgi:membrane dipeptidase